MEFVPGEWSDVGDLDAHEVGEAIDSDSSAVCVDVRVLLLEPERD